MINYPSQLFKENSLLIQNSMLIYADFAFFDVLEPNFFKANQLNFKETLQASKTFSPPLRKGQVE